jgi:hypothetical protein
MRSSNEGVVRRREHGAPQEDQHAHAGRGGNPHREAENERQADAEQADHEQPVGPLRRMAS